MFEIIPSEGMRIYLEEIGRVLKKLYLRHARSISLRNKMK